MNQSEPMVNTTAPIKNVARFTDLVTRLVERPPALPGFGVFSGKAGLGKTFAATYAINKFRAHYVECDFTWTQKAFCKALMIELKLHSVRTPLTMPIYEAVELIGNHIADNPRRPLIIDEADFLVKRRMIEIVRAIYKHCATAGASIILIGEENMPNALSAWERVDSRVLKFTKAVPLDINDISILAKLVAPDTHLSKEVLVALRQHTGGSARRAVTRLYDLREIAATHGWGEVSIDQWNPAEAA